MMNNLVLGQSTFVGSAALARTLQVSKIIASNGVANSRFGWSLSLSLDGNTLAVGADLQTITFPTTMGSVYVCVRSGSTWSEENIFSPTTGITSFGRAVALSGSGDTLVIGAIANTPSDGKAYVSTRSGGGWSSPVELTVPGRALDSGYGNTVEISKDGLWIAVGEPGSSAGNMVHMFRLASGAWVFNNTLLPTGGYLAPFYGVSVAFSFDASTAVVGASNGNNDGTGDAYIYTRSGTTWTLQVKVRGTGVVANTSFGNNVAINEAGDRVIIGSGRKGVWWYKLVTGSWVEQTRVSTQYYGSDEAFGHGASLSPAGSLMFVGGGGASFARFGAGIVRAFTESAGAWSEVASFIASDATVNASLGSQQIQNSYYCHTVAASAYRDTNSNGSAAGAVYIFDPGLSVLPSDGATSRSLVATASLIAAAAIGDTGPEALLVATSSLIPGLASAPAGTTALLMHFNGANGSSTFTDSSASPVTVTEYTGFGDNTLTTGSPAPKLGSAVLKNAAGNGDVLYTPHTSAGKLNLSTGPFNLQVFIYLPSTHGAVSIWEGGYSSNFYSFQISSTNRLVVTRPGLGAVALSPTNSVPVNAWAHIEFSRDASGVIRGFIDGTLQATTTTFTGTYDVGTDIIVMCTNDGGAHTVYYDELRVVTGSAVHTASFTPPTTELT